MKKICAGIGEVGKPIVWNIVGAANFSIYDAITVAGVEQACVASKEASEFPGR